MLKLSGLWLMAHDCSAGNLSDYDCGQLSADKWSWNGIWEISMKLKAGNHLKPMKKPLPSESWYLMKLTVILMRSSEKLSESWRRRREERKYRHIWEKWPFSGCCLSEKWSHESSISGPSCENAIFLIVSLSEMTVWNEETAMSREIYNGRESWEENEI